MKATCLNMISNDLSYVQMITSFQNRKAEIQVMMRGLTKRLPAIIMWQSHQLTVLSQLMRLWYLSHRRPAKVQENLRIRIALPQPSLFAHLKYRNRRRARPKIRHVAPLMAANARLKNEFSEDEKCHYLMRWLNYVLYKRNKFWTICMPLEKLLRVDSVISVKTYYKTV